MVMKSMTPLNQNMTKKILSRLMTKHHPHLVQLLSIILIPIPQDTIKELRNPLLDPTIITNYSNLNNETGLL